MKIKEVDRTANVAWSPAAHHPIYLAAGTAAQQLDATFSTSAALEIYALNLTEPGLDMSLKGSLALEHRFNKIAWGSHGLGAGGVIVGGTDSGNMLVYDPVKLMAGDIPEVFQSDKHTAPIFSLDFNQFQSNLLVSGAGESEILIWDLNNPGSPMNPGAKSQPPEEVSCVAWNRQVQHILASTFPARCVVWDLRKNEPIIKVSDSTARLRCKVVAWHPEVATQLCLASEDDHCPVIQLWDLRFATSPLKTLESHQRGILSIAWCQHDPDLLLSCGKDNRILCWNPNSSTRGGEVVCELATNNQWSFEVAWCPRNPAVISSSSFDGHVSIYSLMGGQQQHQPSSKIAESFPGADAFSQPLPAHQSNQRSVSMPLQKPPKWLRRPVGAVFGFGGKLVSFCTESKQSNPNTPAAVHQTTVYISQVTTEPDIVRNASALEEVLASGNLSEFCQRKMGGASETSGGNKITWSFLNASFEESPRAAMLALLGYDPVTIATQLKPLVANSNKSSSLTGELNNLDLNEERNEFDNIAIENKQEEMFQIKTDTDDGSGVLSRALLSGNIEAAVQLCILEGNWADALVLSQAGGGQLMASTQKEYFSRVVSNTAQLISAVVTSDWEKVVKNCDLDCWKEALAAVLTYARPEQFAPLCETLGRRLEQERNGVSIQHAILCYICAGNLESVTHCWMKTNDTNITSQALQEHIEQIMVLKKTVELAGGQTRPAKSGPLATLLGKYVVLLASQGSLSLANTFINDASEDSSLAILKERIATALSQQPIVNQVFQKVGGVKRQTPPQPQPQQQPLAYQQQYQPQVINQSASSYDFYNPQMAQHNANVAPMMQPQSTPTPPPPPAADAMQRAGGAGLRYPRHVQDSSVYSDAGYGNQNMYGSQQQQQFGFNPQQNNNNFGFNQNQQQPQSYFSVEQSQTTFNAQQTFVPAANVPTANVGRSSVPPPPAFMETKPGWNDPPPLKEGGSKKQQAQQQQQNAFEAPNLHMMNPTMANPEPILPPNQQGFNPHYGLQQHQQQQTPQIQQLQPTPQPVQPVQVAPPLPKEKGPIPPEHQVLQDIFEDLRHQCQMAATNPQIRRKLDDVARKLENLYDKIRENGLSSATTMGLHQIVSTIQQGDYSTCLSIHTQLVSTTNFAETSSFMLGLKVLLQTAQQLGVYLR